MQWYLFPPQMSPRTSFALLQRKFFEREPTRCGGAGRDLTRDSRMQGVYSIGGGVTDDLACRSHDTIGLPYLRSRDGADRIFAGSGRGGGGGGWRNHLLFALVVWPLTVHPF